MSKLSARKVVQFVAVAARACARLLLIYTARDVSESVGHRRALVIAPHPDDETLGCAARIMLSLQAQTRVCVVVVTDGAAGGPPDDPVGIRHAELVLAMSRLGVPENDVVCLAYPDSRSSEHVDQIANELVGLIDQLDADDVYAPCFEEPHPDHRSCALAAMEAVRQSRRPPDLVEYPIWLWVSWPLARHRELASLCVLGRCMIRRTAERISVRPVAARKQCALAAYQSQGVELLPLWNFMRRIRVRNADALSRFVVRNALRGPELYFRWPAGHVPWQ